ncbi:MAG: hypothetical protein AAF658_16010 [Myxococcota bacterium]
MAVFLLTLGFMLIAVFVMSLGVMITGRKLKGSCGGLASGSCACRDQGIEPGSDACRAKMRRAQNSDEERPRILQILGE